MKNLNIIITITTLTVTFAQAGEMTKAEAHAYVRESIANNLYLYHSMPEHEQMLARKWSIIQVDNAVSKYASPDGSLADLNPDNISSDTNDACVDAAKALFPDDEEKRNWFYDLTDDYMKSMAEECQALITEYQDNRRRGIKEAKAFLSKMLAEQQ